MNIPRITIEMQRGGKAVPCSLENFLDQMHSDHVRNICAEIATIVKENSTEGKLPVLSGKGAGERLSQLKKQLPAICWHAQRFTYNKRANTNAIPSGLVMVDLDHIGTASEVSRFYTENVAEHLSALNICYVAITPSGTGLRIVAQLISGETLQDAQIRIAECCNASRYLDGSTKDLARLSFLSPFEYTLYMDNAAFEFMDENIAANVAVCFDYLKQTAPSISSTKGADLIEEAVSNQSSAEEESLPSGGDLEEASRTFKGIPYTSIVSQLIEILGGEPVCGERNTFLFSLARYVRYICDFNEQAMLAVIPSFGLSKNEMMAIIRSSINRPRRADMPDMITRAYEQAKAIEEAKLTKSAEDLVSNLPELPTVLPQPINILCRKLPKEFQPAMVIAALPVLGALATKVRFKYLDNATHSFSFISCISAPAATGKSFIKTPLNLLLTPIDERDIVEREKEQKFKDALKTCKNAKVQPKDPKVCIRHIPVSVSIAKLLQRLAYAEGKHLIAVETEIDTLLKSEKAGAWSQKSDFYRKAFDNDLYGQDYMSDNSFSANLNVFYNLCVTGTPDAVAKFFGNVEDGLVTRVCFAVLPDMFGTSIPDFTEYNKKEQNDIIEAARFLEEQSGLISCPQMDKVISDWVEKKRLLAIETNSRAIDIIRRRSAVIGFRAAMLAFLLNKQRYTPAIGKFGVWVADYIMANQMNLFGDQFEQVGAMQERKLYGKGSVKSLLQELPSEFSKSNLVTIRAKRGQSTNINMILTRWVQAGMVEQISPTQFRKISNFGK